VRALLALEDGSLFPGRALGAPGQAGGEVVFNTAMTGYEEILTDPSYHGQIVVFTAPHIGNYGMQGDEESAGPHAAGVVAREVCETPSHARSRQSLVAYLRAHDRFALSDVDTRALTLRLREKGVLRGWMTTRVEDPAEAVGRARELPRMDQIDAVGAVSTPAAYQWRESRYHDRSDGARPDGPRIVVLDCGVKFGILRELDRRGCQITVLPAHAEPSWIERLSPDGLVLSNGPGDPSALTESLPRIERLLQRYPTLAICLGHQLTGMVFGARIVKLPYGHHGANHPVKDLRTGHVAITSQNHNYAIDPSSVPDDLEVTHVNLNDQTVEGVRHRSRPIWSLQYHPEASPGPHEASGAFDEFVATLTGVSH